jgi:carboxyl-terminal processing protease
VQVKDDANVPPVPRPPANANPGTAWTGPLVVLTNRFSASASEILSGAIKDYRRGLVVGDPTSHGKGTVQSLVNLNERLFPRANLGAGRITIQGYYLPSGVSPQGVGVEVDIVLPSISGAMEGVREADLDNALRFRQIPQAPGFAPRQYVSQRVIDELSGRSVHRIGECEEFSRLLERIAMSQEIRERRATPLHLETFMEEIRRFNSDEWEREEIEDLLSRDRKIKRDFYVEEVLSITVDYMKATQELGIAFPQERTIAPPRRGVFSVFGF